jgi:hypothetical protein
MRYWCPFLFSISLDKYEFINRAGSVLFFSLITFSYLNFFSKVEFSRKADLELLILIFLKFKGFFAHLILPV